MKKVFLTSLYHNNQKQIAVQFQYNDDIRLHLKKIPNIKWSTSYKTFYIEYSVENKQKLYNHLRLINCYVDYSKLKPVKPHSEKQLDKVVLPPLTTVLVDDLNRYKKWLLQKRLSTNTVKTYTEVTSFFLRYALLKNAVNYSKKLIEAFSYDFIVRENKSVSYQNQCINGIKKYLEYKKVSVGLLKLERPKKEKKLPIVLSAEEVKAILESTSNLKHKALLSLIYSAGLRIGEAINLKVKDIDSDRMLIHIQGAKGKKDRYSLLSEVFLNLLRDYYTSYKPKYYLFEGQNNKQYSSSSAQKILKNACKKTNLKKNVTLHTLRHSFATHLLENGTDIRYIQELLGHNSPKTTMIYTHVTKTSIRNIKNPFDNL